MDSGLCGHLRIVRELVPLLLFLLFLIACRSFPALHLPLGLYQRRPETRQANIECLCLSHNHNVTKTTALEVLSAKPTLRKLVLLDTSVKIQTNCSPTIQKLFYSFEAIVHPFFLQRKNIRPIAFTHITFEGVGMKRGGAISLPYFTPGQVVQALTDMLGSTNDPDPEFARGFSLQAAYASELRKEGSPWAERTVPICLDHLSPSLSDGWKLVWVLPSPDNCSLCLLPTSHK